jgi:2-haloalkanoic acid dehalogenase type II
MASVESRPAPSLLTFDIFGTVLDWRRGLVEAAAARGARVGDREFDAVIDFQARLEAEAYRPYVDILAESLVSVLRLERRAARTIAAEAGRWPLFPDAADGLRRLMRVAPCVAMTNSDQAHGRQIQEQLGFRLSGWICAEDVRCYKPAPEFWTAVAARRSQPLDAGWWHVSAYADYDHATAARLGLTTVFIERPHSRWGPSTVTAADLMALATSLGGGSGG